MIWVKPSEVVQAFAAPRPTEDVLAVLDRDASPPGERRAAPTSAWSFYFLPTQVAPQLQAESCLCAPLQLGGLTTMLLLHFRDRDRLRGMK